VNTSISTTFLRRNNNCGLTLTRGRSTNSSLEKRTHFQNSNTTGLNLASSLRIYLQTFSVFSKIFNLLWIKIKRLQLLLHLLLFNNNQFKRLSQRLRRLLLLQPQTHFLDQAAYKLTTIHTESETERQLTTRNFTQESNRDVANYVAKQKRPSHG